MGKEISGPHVVKTYQYNFEGIGAVTAVEVGPGIWCWTTPGFAWQFNERVPPPHPNFSIYVGGRYDYRMRIQQIENGMVYSVGFSYGYKNGVIQGKADADGTTVMVEEVFKESLEKDKHREVPKADEGITSDTRKA